MGTALIATHGSCLPLTSSDTSLPSTSTAFDFDAMLEVGLIINERSISWPDEIPPRIPPELLERYPSEFISSLTSEPFFDKNRSAFPKDTLLTALIETIAFASSASNLSKTGSPRPILQPEILTPNSAPTESPSSISWLNNSSSSGSFDSSQKLYLFEI